MMIAVSYLMKRKIKKIFLEVIFNNKIFNVNFFNEIANDQDFAKLTGGSGQRRIRYVLHSYIKQIIIVKLLASSQLYDFK